MQKTLVCVCVCPCGAWRLVILTCYKKSKSLMMTINWFWIFFENINLSTHWTYYKPTYIAHKPRPKIGSFSSKLSTPTFLHFWIVTCDYLVFKRKKEQACSLHFVPIPVSLHSPSSSFAFPAITLLFSFASSQNLLSFLIHFPFSLLPSFHYLILSEIHQLCLQGLCESVWSVYRLISLAGTHHVQ